jgi:hypothetical protein
MALSWYASLIQPKRKLIHMTSTGEQEVWDGVKLSYDSCFGYYQNLIQKNAFVVGEGKLESPR